MALDTLETEPGLAAASLARACLVSPQAMMVVLKAMDEQGLDVRSPPPRHPNVLELRLTGVGREALYDARKLVAPVEKRLNDAIPVADAQILTGLLERVIDATAPST